MCAHARCWPSHPLPTPPLSFVLVYTHKGTQRRTCPSAYHLLHPKVTALMVPLLKFYFHEEVRRAATSALPHLLRSASAAAAAGAPGASEVCVRPGGEGTATGGAACCCA